MRTWSWSLPACALAVIVFLPVPPTLAADTLAERRDVVQVALGETHTCLLNRAGGVACWGANERAQLGLGDVTGTRRTTPVPVPGLGPGVRAIAAGSFHTCAITATRGVKCWGWNPFGQLGTGNQDDAPRAVEVVLDGPATALSAGAIHTCALLESGALRCWGGNSRGQLGDGSTQDRLRPVPVAGPAVRVTGVEAGAEHTCAVLEGGAIRCWGGNTFGQLGDDTRTDRTLATPVQGIDGAVARIGAAARFTCVTLVSGAVRCWGALQLEGDATGDGSLRARPVPGLESGWGPIDAGVFHACVANVQGAVRCVGDNTLGQAGSGSIESTPETQATVGLAPGVIALGAGGDHTCAVTRLGVLQCWGRNNDGQLGIDRTSERLVPTRVEGLVGDVVAVASGNFHGCALSVAGEVRCWGANGQSQLGDGSDAARLTAVAVQGLGPGVRAIAVGADHSCAIDAQRRALCWGANFDGRLGDGSTLNRNTAVAVQGLDGLDVLALSLGDTHACALLAGGRVRCWGDNQFGQIGDGSSAPRPSAVDVPGLGSGVRAISAGAFHSCALTAAGGVRCWGANDTGQLGDGSFTLRRGPVDVQGLSAGVALIAAGMSHTCAAGQQGAVRCWGDAFFGATLGDGSLQNRPFPGPVPALDGGVTELSAGNVATCARRAGGSLLCWGGNSSGTLGDNSTLARGVPAPVAGGTRLIGGADVGFGGQVCAIALGRALCWGENTFGQVGDGTTFGVPVPRAVLINDLRRRVARLLPSAQEPALGARVDAQGRFVVFQSRAALTSGDSNAASDIFRFDRENGDLQRVSIDDSGAQIGGDSIEPAISAHGRRIVFVAPDAAVGQLRGESRSKRLQRQKGTSHSVYLHNLVTGSTQQVGPAMPSGAGSAPQIAASTAAVVVTAITTDPAEGAPGQSNVYVVPLAADGDEHTPGTPRCVSCRSVDSAGNDTAENANGSSSKGSVSSDGQTVVWETTAKNGLAATPSPCNDATAEVMLRDLASGAAQRISPPADLAAADCGTAGSTDPSIDYDAGVVAFSTDQPLDGDDANAVSDIYVWRKDAGEDPVARVSESALGGDATGASSHPGLSGDGTQVAFVSEAPNLDLSFADDNGVADVHTANLETGDISRLSVSDTGAEAGAPAQDPALNFEGSALAFSSAAALAGGAAGASTVFARANPQAVPTRSATWWIAQESGWGLTVFDQGSVLVPAWFTYDSDGEPTWFLVGGAFPQSDGSYAGNLFRLRGTRFDQITGPATSASESLGTAVLRFAGDEALDFTYPVPGGGTQSKRLTRFAFGTRTYRCSATPDSDRSAATNYSDIWTGNVANAGWGLTLFHVDDALFAAWYTYDVDGESVFFVITAPRQPDGSFSGPMVRQRNGTPFQLIDGTPPSSGSDAVGTGTFRFSDGAHGSFTYRVGAVTQSKDIVRLLVGDAPTQCASDVAE